MEELLPNFSGQTVVFYITGSAGTPSWIAEGVVLDEPSFQNQGGRLFVVGLTPPPVEGEEMDWSDARQACLAWESVLYYFAMRSEEYYAYGKSVEETSKSVEETRVSCERPSTGKRKLVGVLFTVLFLLILAAILVAIIVWTVRLF